MFLTTHPLIWLQNIQTSTQLLLSSYHKPSISFKIEQSFVKDQNEFRNNIFKKNHPHSPHPHPSSHYLHKAVAWRNNIPKQKVNKNPLNFQYSGVDACINIIMGLILSDILTLILSKRTKRAVTNKSTHNVQGEELPNKQVQFSFPLSFIISKS